MSATGLGLINLKERNYEHVLERTEMSESAYWNQMYANALDASSPSVVRNPRIFIDGNQWCALYGENIQDGVAGFGDTPNEAMRDFDKNWMWQTIGKPKDETFDYQIDAARYRWLRKYREEALKLSVFGDQAKTIEDVDNMIDVLIADARTEQDKPKTVKVKSLCWRHACGALIWTANEADTYRDYQRYPAGDLTGEVEA